jgi:20S proteasome subunit alpha 7
VVLGAEKLITSKMLVKGSNKRILNCDTHIGMTLAGIAPDARAIANHAREEAQNYRSFYGSPVPGYVLAERIGGHVHTHTLYHYLRPVGASLLLASYDEACGPQLHQIEPSGSCQRYFATAAGKNTGAAKGELEKLDFAAITSRQACVEIAKILYKLHDDVKDKPMELELSWVCEESDRKHVAVPAEIRDAAIRAAVEAKQRAEMDSDDSDDE